MKHTGLTIMLALLSMLGAWGIDAYLPSFQAIGVSLNASPVAVQQTLSAYIGAMAVTVLFAGTLSDTLGRRPVVLFATLLFAASSVWGVLADDIDTLIMARALQGVAAGIATVLSRTIVQDLFSGAEAQRVMSLITMVFSIAPSVAPVVGGWLQKVFDWHAVFIMLALYGALLWVLCQWGLRESLAPGHRVPMRLGVILRNYGRALTHVRFMLMAGSVSMLFIGIALYVSSAAAFLIDVLKLTETDFAWMFIPMTTGMLLGASAARRLARNVAPERLTAFGMGTALSAALISVIYTQLSSTPAVPWAVLPLGLYTFGMTFALPSMTVTSLSVFPDMRGLAASLQSFVQMAAFSLVSAFVAPQVFHSAQALAWTHLGGLLLGVGLWVLAARLPENTAACSTP
ncbi:MAG: multidrug effflux MFS transporter [Lautropia sp.]|nr:multidrug effflux MFS transporter [Lautropia sp.]